MSHFIQFPTLFSRLRRLNRDEKTVHESLSFLITRRMMFEKLNLMNVESEGNSLEMWRVQKIDRKLNFLTFVSLWLV